MKFTFSESVKLATKGFKPGDISELSELDENKFSKEDILSLVGNGYSKSDIKKLVETFSDDAASEDDPGDGSDETNDHTEKPEKKSSQEDPGEDISDETDDNIDYKELYEKEKKLREKLQHKNTSGSAAIKKEKSDFDIALDIANSI